MRTTPWRRTTLQLRQIFLTEAPTFMTLLRKDSWQGKLMLSLPANDYLTSVIPEIGLAHQITVLLIHAVALQLGYKVHDHHYDNEQ